MLERYLINTLQNHENDFSEALDPNWNDASKSFMGENELMKPATAHEVRSLTTSIVDAIKACAPIRHISPWLVAPTSDTRLIPSVNIETMPPLTEAVTCHQCGNTVAAPTASVLRAASDPVTAHSLPPPLDSPGAEQQQEHAVPAQPLPASAACYIPDLRPREWKRAIVQWHEGEPARGLKALKLWDPELYQGRRKNKVATKRQNRQLVAEEYEL